MTQIIDTTGIKFIPTASRLLENIEGEDSVTCSDVITSGGQIG